MSMQLQTQMGCSAHNDSLKPGSIRQGLLLLAALLLMTIAAHLLPHGTLLVERHPCRVQQGAAQSIRRRCTMLACGSRQPHRIGGRGPTTAACVGPARSPRHRTCRAWYPGRRAACLRLPDKVQQPDIVLRNTAKGQAGMLAMSGCTSSSHSAPVMVRRVPLLQLTASMYACCTICIGNGRQRMPRAQRSTWCRAARSPSQRRSAFRASSTAPRDSCASRCSFMHRSSSSASRAQLPPLASLPLSSASANLRG